MPSQRRLTLFIILALVPHALRTLLHPNPLRPRDYVRRHGLTEDTLYLCEVSVIVRRLRIERGGSLAC